MNNKGGSGSSNSTTPNFDNLLLQSLMSRLQLRSPIINNNHPLIPNNLFSDMLLNLDESDDDDDEYGKKFCSNTPQLAKEESRLEKEIVRTILNKETDKLKPNSGEAVTIGEHHICVGFNQEETGSEYRVWEWHGHIMLFDEENGYTPEYIYGNYFEMLHSGITTKTKDDEEVGNVVGLKELIGFAADPGTGGHILHRNLNANSASPTSSTLNHPSSPS